MSDTKTPVALDEDEIAALNAQLNPKTIMNSEHTPTQDSTANELAVGLLPRNGPQHVEQPDPSHRYHSSYEDLIKSSPIDVVNCTQEQFLTHLFGADWKSVLVTNDPSDFHLNWMSKPGDRYKFFSPVSLSREHEQGPYGNRVSVFDLYTHGRLKYAAFEVNSDLLPEQFTLEVETAGYPTSAVISVCDTTVHMLCRVDAENSEQYRDRCELIFRMAHDIYDCERSAKQISFCNMPTLNKGNLLYLAPDEKWRLPIPTKDFA